MEGKREWDTGGSKKGGWEHVTGEREGPLIRERIHPRITEPGEWIMRS
jgi:hypothetical protein